MALEGLNQDGLLVLQSIVDVGHIDHLRDLGSAETQSIMKDSSVVEQRRPRRPPVQPVCSKGDILIRDLRV